MGNSERSARAVKEWVQGRKAELSERTRKLISAANYDLYYGPSGGGLDDDDSIYPGFESACREISRELKEALPSALYIDDQDTITESEPTRETCAACNGEGFFETADEDRYDCEDCDGTGSLAPSPYSVIDYSTILTTMVGRELAPYVR